MAKYRVWYGDGPDYKKMSSLADAIKYFRKHSDLEEDESGIEENIDGEWDEWLDEDDQNVHEHLYMYGGKSAYLRVEEDEDEDDEFDDDEDVEEDEDDDSDEGDMEDRLMNVIGGNARGKSSDEEVEEDEEESFDDDEDDDFDDEEDED